jgi:hypothetical protein
MQAIETFKNGNKILKIYQDECYESPREWDNLGTMVCFHRRYDLGDKDHGYVKSDYSSWDGLFNAISKKAAIVLPLYLYDHGGPRIKVGSFNGLLPGYHAEFDTMRVGFIFITKAKIRHEMVRVLSEDRTLPWNKRVEKIKHVTKEDLERAEKYLRGEVEVYDQYLSGDVYGFRCVTLDTDKVKIYMKPYDIGNEEDIPEGDLMELGKEDSCWGFYGTDWKTNGLFDHAGWVEEKEGVMA